MIRFAKDVVSSVGLYILSLDFVVGALASTLISFVVSDVGAVKLVEVSIAVVSVFLGVSIAGLAIISGTLTNRDFLRMVREIKKENGIYGRFLSVIGADCNSIIFALMALFVLYAFMFGDIPFVKNPFIFATKMQVIAFIVMNVVSYALSALRDIVNSLVEVVRNFGFSSLD